MPLSPFLLFCFFQAADGECFPMTAQLKPDRFGGGRERRQPAGVTLLELVIATLILSIASVGALTYQYHAAKRAHSAQAELTAAQLAQLVIDDWKSTGGDEFYDPADLDLGLEELSNSRIYRIRLNDFPMRVGLEHNDVEIDEAAGVTLREIRVVVRWRRDYKDLEPAGDDPVFISTTYVRRDQSGG